MKLFDEELRRAFRRVEPPPGFVEGVIFKIRQSPEAHFSFRRVFSSFFRHSGLRWAAASGLACVLAIAAVLQHRQHVQARIEGEAAKAQARVALQIASAELNAALRDLERLDRRSGKTRER